MKLVLVFCLFLVSLGVDAQVVDVISQADNSLIDYPSYLALDGDDLYINSENENKIFKINTLAQTPTLELVLNLYRSYLFILNDILYTSFSSIFASNVAQCNITNTLPLSLFGFVTLPDNYVVRGIAVKSSTVYFVTSNISGLFKID